MRGGTHSTRGRSPCNFPEWRPMLHRHQHIATGDCARACTCAIGGSLGHGPQQLGSSSTRLDLCSTMFPETALHTCIADEIIRASTGARPGDASGRLAGERGEVQRLPPFRGAPKTIDNARRDRGLRCTRPLTARLPPLARRPPPAAICRPPTRRQPTGRRSVDSLPPGLGNGMWRWRRGQTSTPPERAAPGPHRQARRRGGRRPAGGDGGPEGAGISRLLLVGQAAVEVEELVALLDEAAGVVPAPRRQRRRRPTTAMTTTMKDDDGHNRGDVDGDDDDDNDTAYFDSAGGQSETGAGQPP